MKLFNVIFEDIKYPKEESPDDVFGSWFNPTTRKLLVNEPNTKQEDQMIDALSWFMLSYDESELIKNKKLIYDIISKNKYPGVFNPGEITVYRGLSLPKYMVNNLLSSIINQDAKREILESIKAFSDKTIDVSLNLEGMLKPEEGKLFQSWSQNHVIAIDFASKKFHDFGIVFHAYTADSIFFGRPVELAKSINAIEEESETISVGPVKFFKVEIFKLS